MPNKIMRCKACNVILSDKEATLKDHHGYLDMCIRCLAKGAGDDDPYEYELDLEWPLDELFEERPDDF